MHVSFQDAIRELKTAPPAAIYLLYDLTDGWFLDRLLSSITDALARLDRPYALSRVSAAHDRLHELELALGEGSLFGDLALVCASEFDDVGTAFKGKTPDQLIAILEGQLKRTEADAPLLVLVTTQEKPDERKKWVKSLTASVRARVIRAGGLTRQETELFAQELLMNFPALTAAQKRWLIARTGERVGQLARELQKIETFLSGQTSISQSDLDALVPDYRASDVFEVVRLSVSGKGREAYAAYQRLGEDKSTFGLLALLTRQYRYVLRIIEAERDRVSDADLCAILGLRSFMLKSLKDQARTLTGEACSARLRELSDIEYQIKTGQLKEQTAIELYFARRLCLA
ncbi:DNA polymerase III subunit delta [Ferroacidibacillus organovorans]|uniref:DNA-directed DNA polymerase n=1 Tax=Ferroacidibacillus organovorans TaxID=1765683 RepID=A0A101XTL3_9BACL|nr:hypothetical protein [Ferroacidibacillus organovorans]KUO97377.1 hypothetical protein ATW55_05770 [Ferroacidibacillus organovorans]